MKIFLTVVLLLTSLFFNACSDERGGAKVSHPNNTLSEKRNNHNIYYVDEIEKKESKK